MNARRSSFLSMAAGCGSRIEHRGHSLLRLLLVCGFFGLGAVSLGACDVDTRYHRCTLDADCGRDDQGRALYCACDGICRARCATTPKDDSEKCRAGERCASSFCIHQDETDAKLGVSCEVAGNKGNCAFGVTACGVNGDIICQITNKAGTEICDGQDNDCNGKIDDDLVRACTNACGRGFERCSKGVWDGCDATQSRVCQSSNESCQDGIEHCKEGAWSGICEGEVKPTPEICDGKDNDCDGQIDEGLTQDCENDCGKGVRQCIAGVLGVCDATNVRVCGTAQGECATGVQACRGGIWDSLCKGAIGPTAEVCDGKDNNCDGKIDEDWPTRGNACETGVGECRSLGVNQCTSDGRSIECTAKAMPPQAEICDGKDNDCNGVIDDGIEQPCANLCGNGKRRCLGGKWAECDATSSRTCGPLVFPPCAQGAELCQEGKWTGVCVGQIKPSPEICDGKDNDCDGQIDEDFPALKKVCFASGTGSCAAPGANVCKADGSGTECNAVPAPSKPEICNGFDDDCDGIVDNLKPIVLSGHTSAVTGVVYTLGGQGLATSSIDGSAILWDRGAKTPTRLFTLQHNSPVYSVAYEETAALVATGAADKLVRIWNARTGQLVRTLTGHTDVVTRVSFDRFGQLLLSASADNTIKVWLVATGALLQTLGGHQAAIYGAAFGSLSSVVASGGNDKKGLIWNLRRGTSTPFWNVNATIHDMAFGPLGLELFVGSSDQLIRRYFVVELDILGHRYQQALLTSTLTHHKEAVLGLAVHPKGGHLLSGSADDTVALWEQNQSSPLRVLTGPTNDVRAVAFRPNTNEVAASSDDQNAYIWECLPLPK